MKRLLGYIVKLPDGTRSEHTRRPVSLAYASAHLCDDGVVVPVFSKPKPAPVAPVVAAEGLYGWLDATDGSWVHVGPMPRAEAVARPNLRNRERKLVRILDDGEHEAAIAAARREERERIVKGVIAAFAAYDRECWARVVGSAYSTGAVAGCRNRFMAVVTGEEAAKGQAK